MAKRKEVLKELREKSHAALLDQARSVAEESMKIRFRWATGTGEGSHRRSASRRMLARILTVAGEQRRKEQGRKGQE